MTNKSTNKNRSSISRREIDEFWLSLAHKEPSKPASINQMQPMMDTVLSTWTSNDAGTDGTDMTTRIRKSIASKLKIHNFVGMQPMAQSSGSVYVLQWGPTLNDSKTLEIVSRPIIAKDWCFSTTMQQIKGCPDAYADELICAYTSEICSEIHNGYMDLMYEVSTKVDFRINLNDSPDTNLDKIVAGANEIARNARRGAGNKVILPYDMYHHLIPALQKVGFSPAGGDGSVSDVMYCGTALGMDIYSSMRNTVVLIGYKGDAGETDVGIYHAPYQLEVAIREIPPYARSEISTHYNYGQYMPLNVGDYYVSMQVR